MGSVHLDGKGFSDGGTAKLHSPAATQAVKDRITDSGLPAEDFTVGQFFLDFLSADILSYDPEKSYFPPTVANFTVALQGAMHNYFTAVGEKSVLGYTTQIKDTLAAPQMAATYQPTFCSYSMSYAAPSAQEAKEGYINKRSALNYLMMYNGNKPPSYTNNLQAVEAPLLPEGSDSSIDGVMAYPYTAFTAAFIDPVLPLIASGIQNMVDAILKAKKMNIGYSGGTNSIYGSISDWSDISTQVNTVEGEILRQGAYSWGCGSPIIFPSSYTGWQINVRAFAKRSDWVPTGTSPSSSSTHVTYTETINISPGVSVSQPANGKGVQVTISLGMSANQRVHTDTYGSLGSELKHSYHYGHVVNSAPAKLTLTLFNEGHGKIVAKTNSTPAEFTNDPVDLNGFDGANKALITNIDVFNKLAQSIPDGALKGIENKVSAVFGTAVVLPLGNLYSFQELTFLTPPPKVFHDSGIGIQIHAVEDDPTGSDNALLNYIAYDPVEASGGNGTDTDTTNTK